MFEQVMINLGISVGIYQSIAKFVSHITGWSTSIFDTLTGSYDNTNTRLKKNVVGIHSVHIDISSKTHNLKFSKFLLSKKLNSKLGSILAQNSTYNFEAV